MNALELRTYFVDVCEAEARNLLVIYDRTGAYVYHRCVDTSTETESVVIDNLPYMPPGEYLAELWEPRTRRIVDEESGEEWIEDTSRKIRGLEPFRAREEFRIEPIPNVSISRNSPVREHRMSLDAPDSTWNGQPGWVNVVHYVVEGPRIPLMRFTDGIPSHDRIAVPNFSFEYGPDIYRNENYRNEDGDIVVNTSFIIAPLEIRVQRDDAGTMTSGVRFCTVIRTDLPNEWEDDDQRRTITCENGYLHIRLDVKLYDFDRPILQRRYGTNKLEYNINYADRIVTIDTRESIADYIKVEVFDLHGQRMHISESNRRQPEQITLRERWFNELIDIPMACLRSSSGDIHMLPRVRVSAVMLFEDPNNPGTLIEKDPDVLELLNLQSEAPWNQCTANIPVANICEEGHYWAGTQCVPSQPGQEEQDCEIGFAWNSTLGRCTSTAPPIVIITVPPEEHVIWELKIRRKTVFNPDGSLPTNPILVAGHTEYITPTLRSPDARQNPTDPTFACRFENMYPFNRIRPCWVRDDGFVEAYLKKDDLCTVDADATPFGGYTNGTNLTGVAGCTGRDYLQRTDGNVMVEFPNLWYNSYEQEDKYWETIEEEVEVENDEGQTEIVIRTTERVVVTDEWLIVQISSNQMLEHWRATNTKLDKNNQPVIHDTIYLGAYYSEAVTRTIDGEDYVYYNSNRLKDTYLGSEHFVPPSHKDLPDTIDTRRNVIGNLGDDFDVLSFQNLTLLKLLQVFRFCSTANIRTERLDIVRTVNGNIVGPEKHQGGNPYNVSNLGNQGVYRFACLDYPFGFGVRTVIEAENLETGEVTANPSNVVWDSASRVPEFIAGAGGSGTVYMPAVFGAYYGMGETEHTTTLRTTLGSTDILTVIPDPFYNILDDNLNRINTPRLFNQPEESGRRRVGLSQVVHYKSNSGWNKPLDIVSEIEDNDRLTIGETLPLVVSPIKGATHTISAQQWYESSFGHVMSQQKTGLYTDNGIQFISPWKYDLLYRLVWWKPNERRILNVTCQGRNVLDITEQNPMIGYVLPGQQFKCIIKSDSIGWKQVIYVKLSGQTTWVEQAVQYRINRPFADADKLIAEVEIGLRINRIIETATGERIREEPHMIKVVVYDTNDRIAFEKEFPVFVMELPLNLTNLQTWTTNSDGGSVTINLGGDRTDEEMNKFTDLVDELDHVKQELERLRALLAGGSP